MRVSHDTNLQPGNRRRISRWASVSSCRVTQLKPLQSLNQSLNKRCCWRQRPDIKRIMSRSLRTDEMRPVTFLYWREAQTLSWRSPEEEFFPAGTRYLFPLTIKTMSLSSEEELLFSRRIDGWKPLLLDLLDLGWRDADLMMLRALQTLHNDCFQTGFLNTRPSSGHINTEEAQHVWSV